MMRARARPLFLRKVFQILFRISESNGKNENPKKISQYDLSAEIRFRISRSIANPKSGLKPKSRFPNRTIVGRGDYYYDRTHPKSTSWPVSQACAQPYHPGIGATDSCIALGDH